MQIVRDRTVVAVKQVMSIIRLAGIVNQSNVRFVVTMLTVHQIKLLEQTQVNIFVNVILDMKEIQTLNVLISMSVLGAWKHEKYSNIYIFFTWFWFSGLWASIILISAGFSTIRNARIRSDHILAFVRTDFWKII